jgi:hypothetical protein
MKKNIILCVLLLAFVGIIKSQNNNYLNVRKTYTENSKVKANIVGIIDSAIYVSTTHKKKSNSLRLFKYSKINDDLLKTVNVKKESNREGNYELKFAKYYNTFISNNILIVVWSEINNIESKLIIQTYDKDLNIIEKPRIIYKLPNSKKAVSKAHPFFLVSPDGSKYIAGCEESAEQGANVKLQYKILNQELKTINIIQVELPYSINNKTKEITSELRMDNNGELFFNTRVSFNEKLSTGNGKTSELLGSINPESSEVKYSRLRANGSEIISFRYEIYEDSIHAFGISYDDDDEVDSKNSNTEEKKSEKKYYYFSFNINRKTFLKSEKTVSIPLSSVPIAYNDFELTPKEKQRYNIDEYALRSLKLYNVDITGSFKTDDNGMLLSLSSQQFTTICNQGCSDYTDFYGIYFLKINDKEQIEWISCVQQDERVGSFINRPNKIIQEKGKINSFVQTWFKRNTLYSINEKSGMIEKSHFHKKYYEETKEVLAQQLYIVGLNKKISKFGIGGCLLSTAFVAYSVLTFPYIAPIGVVAFYLFTQSKVHTVAFGKFKVH